MGHNFKDHVRDWTSSTWHKTHNWKTGTGKLIKRALNKKIRKHKSKEEPYDCKHVDKIPNDS